MRAKENLLLQVVRHLIEFLKLTKRLMFAIILTKLLRHYFLNVLITLVKYLARKSIIKMSIILKCLKIDIVVRHI